MSLALDGIIIIVVVFIIVLAAKKGLVRSVMGLFSSVASLIVAYAFAPVVSGYINENYLLGKMTDNISKTLKGWSLDTSSDLFNLDRLASNPTPDFQNVLERYGVGLEKISDSLRGLVGVGENEVNNIAERIAEPTSSILSSAIAFILIFIAALIVLKLITLLLDAIFKLPVLSGINRVLGVLFGIAEAGLVASVLAVVLYVLVTSLGAISPSLFGKQVVDNTVICKFLVEDGLFGWLKTALGA